jgi:hypothetical protein
VRGQPAVVAKAEPDELIGRNVAHVARLEAQGRMLPLGVAAVEAAKADGRWAAAYAPPSEAEVPADLIAAIAADTDAQRMFDVLTKANRFGQRRQTGRDARAKDPRGRGDAGPARDDLPAEGQACEPAALDTFMIWIGCAACRTCLILIWS